MKLHIKNDSGYKLEICCGMEEFELGHRDEVTVEVKDEDVIYIDQVNKT